jgi:hypothetical protein
VQGAKGSGQGEAAECEELLDGALRVLERSSGSGLVLVTGWRGQAESLCCRSLRRFFVWRG